MRLKNDAAYKKMKKSHIANMPKSYSQIKITSLLSFTLLNYFEIMLNM